LGRRPLVSLFTGAGGLDYGLHLAGLHPVVMVESDEDCRETLTLNFPDARLTTPGDITLLSGDDILAAAGLEVGEAFCVSGGPPCQSFSTGGKRGSIKDPRGALFEQFIRVIRELRPRYFVFENVAQLLTAPIRHRPIRERPGQNWNLSAYSSADRVAEDGRAPLEKDEMAGSAFDFILQKLLGLGYYFVFGVLSATDYGVPQHRLRLFVLGSRNHDCIYLPTPSHAHPDLARPPLKPWVTLREGLEGLEDKEAQHSRYSPRYRRYFELVPPGGNWRDLPQELQIEALGERAYKAGGGKTGFFRRLSWDKPSPTITGKPNRKSAALCHPSETRPLTVKECARLQGFPDDWRFAGSMYSRYLQIGNAVPVQLGRAIGKALLEADEAAHDVVLDSQDLVRRTMRKLPEMRMAALQVLRRNARNKRSRRRDVPPLQQALGSLLSPPISTEGP